MWLVPSRRPGRLRRSGEAEGTVLIVYFTLTKQSGRVVDAVAKELGGARR
jgi:hypothetical protein